MFWWNEAARDTRGRLRFVRRRRGPRETRLGAAKAAVFIKPKADFIGRKAPSSFTFAQTPRFTIEKRIRFKYNKNRNRQAAIKRGKRIDKTETHEEEGYFENPPESAYKYVLELA
ncbi:MAG: hypothetical protein J5925_04180 [Clostridia bacterium]|nr:hypothetical protein [Clostridia bacterium]